MYQVTDPYYAPQGPLPFQTAGEFYDYCVRRNLRFDLRALQFRERHMAMAEDEEITQRIVVPHMPPGFRDEEITQEVYVPRVPPLPREERPTLVPPHRRR